jgi:hypothetical protein
VQKEKRNMTLDPLMDEREKRKKLSDKILKNPWLVAALVVGFIVFHGWWLLVVFVYVVYVLYVQYKERQAKRVTLRHRDIVRRSEGRT